MLAVSVQRIHTQFEPAVGGQLVGEQPIQRRGQAQFVAQMGFRHRLYIFRLAQRVSHVDLEAVELVDLGHHQLQFVGGADGIAGAEDDPRQGRIVDGVGTLLFYRRVAHGDQTVIQFLDDAEAQFGFGFA